MEIVGALKSLIESESLRKEQAQIHPAYITLLYASNKILASKEQVMEAAKELQEWGIIEIGRTINDYYYKIKSGDSN